MSSVECDERMMASKKQFIEDVVNAVNDLVMEGFSGMEEFAAQALNLETEDARHALKQGVDGVYCQVQDNIDECLSRWESICRDQYFIISPELEAIDVSKNKDMTTSVPEDARQQEAALDTELNSLRSQLIAAEREGTKMRRQLASLDKHLALRREVLSDVKFMEESLGGAMLEDVIKSTRLLQETMAKAISIQDRRRGATMEEEVRELRVDGLRGTHTEVVNLFPL